MLQILLKKLFIHFYFLILDTFFIIYLDKIRCWHVCTL